MLEKMSKTPPMGTMITPPTSPVILSGIPWQKSSEIPDDILNFPNPEGTMKSPEVNFIINKVCIQCAEYRSKIDELEIKSDEIKNAIKTINSDIDQFEIESNEKFEIEMTIQNSGNSVETSSDDEEITKLTKDIVGIENIDLISENKRIKQEAENLKKELLNMKITYVRFIVCFMQPDQNYSRDLSFSELLRPHFYLERSHYVSHRVIFAEVCSARV